MCACCRRLATPKRAVSGFPDRCAISTDSRRSRFLPVPISNRTILALTIPCTVNVVPRLPRWPPPTRPASRFLALSIPPTKLPRGVSSTESWRSFGRRTRANSTAGCFRCWSSTAATPRTTFRSCRTLTSSCTVTLAGASAPSPACCPADSFSTPSHSAPSFPPSTFATRPCRCTRRSRTSATNCWATCRSLPTQNFASSPRRLGWQAWAPATSLSTSLRPATGLPSNLACVARARVRYARTAPACCPPLASCGTRSAATRRSQRTNRLSHTWLAPPSTRSPSISQSTLSVPPFRP
mmetsp:Transcript_11992/g.38146  ORF Transcript_11992/g.38146 Transcript_11992/m.38146 type:complete len:296 (+) Transcript_11992:315-1202(+)